MPHPLNENRIRPYWAFRRQAESEVGAFEPAPCEGETTTGKPCGNFAMKFCERPVCVVHGTEKEVKLNRLKTGTANARAQNTRIFGDL